MATLVLTIEKTTAGVVWGRVVYDDDLLVDSAKSVEALEKRFRKLLKQFHELDPEKVKFKIAYDLTSVFEHNDFLNVSAVAKRVGINSSLLRQYTSGVKVPSHQTANRIETVIHSLAKQLATVRISTPRSSSILNKKIT